jgi:hypothetical protein
MRRISSLLLLTILSSPKDSLMSSTALSWDHPVTDKIIVISDSDEEEAHEEKTTDTKDVAASATVNPTSNASVDADDALAGAKNDNSDAQVPIIRLATTMAAEMTPVSLRLPRQEGGKAGVLQGKLQ